MIRPIACLLAALVLGAVACGTPAPKRHYEKPGATQGDLERDSQACIDEIMENSPDAEANRRYEHQVKANEVVECMKAKGWVVVEGEPE